MESRIQIVAIIAIAALFVIVFELVRRRRLMERYALLWLASTAVLLALAVWKALLDQVASAVGIFYAPSALFAVAFGAVLVMLLHFSLVISRLVGPEQDPRPAHRPAPAADRRPRAGRRPASDDDDAGGQRRAHPQSLR